MDNFDFNVLDQDANKHGWHIDGASVTTDVADVPAKFKGKKDAAPVADEPLNLTPLAPTHDENKGFMRFMPALIKEMNHKGVPFTLNGTTGEIQLSGFYRAQGVTMEIGAGDAISVTDRRGTTPVNTFADLATLNYEWWTRSNARGENLNPERPWLDEFLEKGWVKRQVIYVPRDAAQD
ncbi:hypothetical protein OVY01_22870 [Robbsia sp. Bb-Pol-6]|uniref:Uncharacterized protein n=1 Tax=Robbsia betulipollinis TaxID=2981849 RepID=A0ABT3ZTS5_9BURK|nr:hypothetical protein [Robbsia betulipollinis]MCY0389984.1 hypothetical protein [Robbsia betulipollinis]